MLNLICTYLKISRVCVNALFQVLIIYNPQNIGKKIRFNIQPVN